MAKTSHPERGVLPPSRQLTQVVGAVLDELNANDADLLVQISRGAVRVVLCRRAPVDTMGVLTPIPPDEAPEELGSGLKAALRVDAYTSDPEGKNVFCTMGVDTNDVPAYALTDKPYIPPQEVFSALIGKAYQKYNPLCQAVTNARGALAELVVIDRLGEAALESLADQIHYGSHLRP